MQREQEVRACDLGVAPGTQHGSSAGSDQTSNPRLSPVPPPTPHHLSCPRQLRLHFHAIQHKNIPATLPPGKEMCAVMRGTYAGFWIPRQGTWLWVIQVWDGIEIVGTAADDFIVAVFFSPLPNTRPLLHV